MSDENISESKIIRAEDEPVVNLHTVFVALYPLLGLYAHNLDKTPLAALVRPIMAVVVFSWIVTFIFRRLLRNRDKGAAAATVVVAAIFSGWSILLFLIAIVLPSVSGYPDWVYYAAYTVFFIVAAAYLSTRARG